jgi:hypothetical protein
MRYDPFVLAMLLSCGSPSDIDPGSSRSSGWEGINWATAIRLVLLFGSRMWGW